MLRFRKSIRGEDHVVVGEVNPEEQLEIGRGVFKRRVKPPGAPVNTAARVEGVHPATGDNVLITDRALQPAGPGRLASERVRR
jgi:class 3 adenylate cyclase